MQLNETSKNNYEIIVGEKVVGMISVQEFGEKTRGFNIVISEENRNQGYGKEATKLILNKLKKEGFEVITCVDENNEVSLRMLGRAGMKRMSLDEESRDYIFRK